jgi:hypothetical protein
MARFLCCKRANKKAACAIDSTEVHRAALLLLPRNFQWYWNSAVDPCSTEEWQKYTDVENEIIEDGCNQKRSHVKIDGGYVIDLKHQVQYKNDDSRKRHQIKRVQFDEDRRDVHPRERFTLPVALVSSTCLSQEGEEKQADKGPWKIPGFFITAYYDLKLKNKRKTLADIVEEAAQGIIKEGNMHGKTNEAQWLAKQLLAVKHSGASVKAVAWPENPSNIGQTCVWLYTRDSFWYRLVNHILYDPQAATREQLKTIGPFCYLLNRYLRSSCTPDIRTVYRGLNLNDEQRQEFMCDKLMFTSFTSTSRNRALAEIFGDTLLIIDVDVKMFAAPYANVWCGADISCLSNFPEEEEFLIWPTAEFHFVKYEYDTVEKKHIIYLRSTDTNN